MAYNPLISLPSLELDFLQPGQMMPEYDVGDGHRDYYNSNSNGNSNNFGESTFIRNPNNGTGATVTAAGAAADASTVRRRPTLPDIQVPPEPELSYIGNHVLWPHGDIPTAARAGASDSGGDYGHGYDRHGWHGGHDGYGRYYDVHVDG
ncbi:hypothetical protein BGZ98_009276 [Dissophora globulifera]|nr:hypothetical protein BGZ98_009276 [Dissophora globulifera]